MLESTFSFTVVIFFIVLLGVLIKNFKHITIKHFKHTVQILFIFIVLSLLIVLLTIESIRISNSLLVLGIVFKILLTTLFIITGLFFCEKIDQIDIPLIKSIFEYNKLNFDLGRFLKYLLIFLVVNISFTIIIANFIQFNKSGPDNLNQVYNFNNFSNYNSIKQFTIYLLSQTQNAIDEEIIFRLCFMSFIIYVFSTNKNKFWIGIIISSLFFAISHYQVTNEPIVKLIQVLPLGIGLGVIYKNFGIESSVVSHLSFNLIMEILHRIGCFR